MLITVKNCYKLGEIAYVIACVVDNQPESATRRAFIKEDVATITF